MWQREENFENFSTVFEVLQLKIALNFLRTHKLVRNNKEDCYTEGQIQITWKKHCWLKCKEGGTDVHFSQAFKSSEIRLKKNK